MRWLIQHPRAFLAVAYVTTTAIIGVVTILAIRHGELIPMLEGIAK